MRKNTISTERAVWRLNKLASLLVVLLGMALKEILYLGAVWQQVAGNSYRARHNALIAFS